MDARYDADVLEWSEHQAGLLRRIASGEPANERPDWTNIIDELESVGRSELNAVESLWILAFLHDLKADAWPISGEVPHWRAEARLFRRQARRRFTPSMRQRIDVSELYEDAIAGMPDAIDGQSPRPVPSACPVTLDQLLDGR